MIVNRKFDIFLNLRKCILSHISKFIEKLWVTLIMLVIFVLLPTASYGNEWAQTNFMVFDLQEALAKLKLYFKSLTIFVGLLLLIGVWFCWHQAKKITQLQQLLLLLHAKNIEDTTPEEEETEEETAIQEISYPVELDNLRRYRSIKTSESGLWHWTQDMLLYLPKHSLKSHPTLRLPKEQKKFSHQDWLEFGLRKFKIHHFSDAMQAFHKSQLGNENAKEVIYANFMKMQILFRLELWEDAVVVANKIIAQHHKEKKDKLIVTALANAYIVNGGYHMIFREDEKKADQALQNAIICTRKLDVHDMLMAGTILHAYLYKVALYARSSPHIARSVMHEIVEIFVENVVPEIRIICEDIEDFTRRELSLKQG